MQNITEEYLYAHRTKGYGNTFKSICPECGGNDLYYTAVNGFAYCFNCAAKYTTQTYVSDIEYKEEQRDVESIRRLYKRLRDRYAGNITEQHRRYFNERGIDDAAIQAFGLGFCPSETIEEYYDPSAESAGIINRNRCPILADRYTFPYIDDDEITDIRGRASQPNQDPKYKACRWSSKSRGAITPYNYICALRIANEKKYCIITEGEIKAIVAHQYGFPCVALPGIRSWRDGTKLSADITPIIIFDSVLDNTKQRDVDDALCNVAEHLVNVHVVRLPLLGETKMDLDTYILHKKGGPQRLSFYINHALDLKEYNNLRVF